MDGKKERGKFSFRQIVGLLYSPFSGQVAPISEETEQIMKDFRVYVKIRYNTENVQHEQMLQTYWNVCFPNESLKSRNCREQWEKLGFQGKDPASDFRGAGVFGLRCLLYFATAYPNTFSEMLHGEHSEEQERYRFSIAGLNIVMMIFEFLGWGFKQIEQDPKVTRNLVQLLFESEYNFKDHPEPSFDEFKLSVGITGMKIERKFYELFCYIFLALHKDWYSRKNVAYMDFPTVLQATSDSIRRQLQEGFISVESLLFSNSLGYNVNSSLPQDI